MCEGIGTLGCKRIGVELVMAAAKRYQLAGGRLNAAWVAVAGVRHHAGRIGTWSGVLWNVTPVGAGVALRMARTSGGRVWVVVAVNVFVGLRMDGLAPSPSRSVITRQCGSATATPEAGWWI